jgi:hypothetical protein
MRDGVFATAYLMVTTVLAILWVVGVDAPWVSP